MIEFSFFVLVFRFIQSCSLSGLLERPESLKNETEKDSSDNWQLQPITVSVVVDGDSVTFDKICKLMHDDEFKQL